MIVFHYDKTFDGLLTAVFDAYNRKSFPEMLLALQEPEPLFVTESFTVVTDPDKSKRVWTGLKKKTNDRDAQYDVVRVVVGIGWR